MKGRGRYELQSTVRSLNNLSMKRRGGYELQSTVRSLINL